jgi:hypothetical protein
MQPDKTVMIGHHHMPVEYSRYGASWGRGRHNIRNSFATVTFLPRIELMFRYTNLMGEKPIQRRGYFMDRMVAGRLLILKESDHIPALLFGMHDPGNEAGFTANRYYGANYVVTSKAVQFRGFFTDLHLGYAFDLFDQPTETFDGVFGGFSVTHSKLPQVELMLEHDSFRINAGAKILILKRIQILAGLIELKRPAGGISYRHSF